MIRAHCCRKLAHIDNLSLCLLRKNAATATPGVVGPMYQSARTHRRLVHGKDMAKQVYDQCFASVIKSDPPVYVACLPESLMVNPLLFHVLDFPMSRQLHLKRVLSYCASCLLFLVSQSHKSDVIFHVTDIYMLWLFR